MSISFSSSWGINLRYLQWLTISIVTLFPIVVFAVPKGANASFYVLLLLAFASIIWRWKPMGKSFGSMVREYWPIHLSMAGLVIAILINQIVLGDLNLHTFDAPSRLASFSLLSWILLMGSTENMKKMEWGLIIGALICAVTLYIETAAGTARPLGILKVPLIPFGNMAMLMGILALVSIGWNNSSQKITIACKVVAGIAALYGSYLSQTRGGWVALPIFFMIAFVLLREVDVRHKLTFAVIALLLLFSIYAVSGTIQKRINEAKTEVSQFFEGKNPDTSVGIRFQLWHGAWVLIKEHPVFGIGREHYSTHAQQLAERHVITPDAAVHPHSHNDLLFHMATLGVFGLLAILSLYVIPAFYFAREIRHPDRQTSTIAAMGLVLSLGFFVFGMTDVMFYWTISHTFYTMILAALFAHLVKRKAELTTS